ncbi:hypothetical protein ABZX93_25375 [Streptomyces sp. NPDC006632]|uniref:hypothetical protein n=1 Tax=unclassified Streptomyces TaxID=2593676 RepID=UPI00224D472D|nr:MULTISPECIES: hypothetical protein [unclassified Streptomyces]MCX5383724.1 hypothetical protein [Streptomyces sp. NBC_00083]
MPPTFDRRCLRPADVVNAEIRSLWEQSDGRLSPDEEERYRRLLVEWAAAVRDDTAQAA